MGAIYNYYVEAHIDGRHTPLKAGPRGREGGIDVTIKMRDGGTITSPLRILGGASESGMLMLDVVDSYGNTIWSHETER